MEHIKITGLPFDASRIGLGTWAIGGWLWGGTEESDAIKTIHAALDNGINLIDTAPVYGFGRSEELVGKALQGGRRADAIIATKVGLDWGSGKILRNSIPARLRQELEDSLRRLKTDVIDIYQVHWPDASVPFEERRQERSRPFAARERTAPSASAIFRRSRWTASGRGRRSPPSSRPTICSSVRSKMARSAAGCSPARSPRRRNSKATTCARPTRNSGNRGFASISRPSSGSTASPAALRQDGACACRPLAARPRQDRGTVGRPPAGSARPGRRRDGLDARRRRHAGDRPHPCRDYNGRRRSGIHGAAAVTAGRTEQAEAG